MLSLLGILITGCGTNQEPGEAELTFPSPYTNTYRVSFNSNTYDPASGRLTIRLDRRDPSYCENHIETAENSILGSERDPESLLRVTINQVGLSSLKVDGLEYDDPREVFQGPLTLGSLSFNSSEPEASFRSSDPYAEIRNADNALDADVYAYPNEWNTIEYSCDPKWGFELYLTGTLAEEHRGINTGYMTAQISYDGRFDSPPYPNYTTDVPE